MSLYYFIRTKPIMIPAVEIKYEDEITYHSLHVDG